MHVSLFGVWIKLEYPAFICGDDSVQDTCIRPDSSEVVLANLHSHCLLLVGQNPGDELWGDVMHVQVLLEDPLGRGGRGPCCFSNGFDGSPSVSLHSLPHFLDIDCSSCRTWPACVSFILA